MSKFIEKIFPWKKNRQLLREIEAEQFVHKKLLDQLIDLQSVQKNLLEQLLDLQLKQYQQTEINQKNWTALFEQKQDQLVCRLDSLNFQLSMGEKKRRHEAAKQRILRKIACGEKIEVLFIHIVRGTFKLQHLYHLFDKHPAFSIGIIKAPHLASHDKNSPEDILADIISSETEFKEAGLKFHPCRQLADGSFTDPLQEINPDIVFFNNPYELSLSEYYNSSHYPDSLSYYVPYGIMTAAIQKHQYDQDFHMRMYKCFCESKKHLLMAKKYSRNMGDNVVVSGYPWFDDYKEDHSHDPWKQREDSQQTQKKRLIWAPHHMLESWEAFNWSSFLFLSEFMLDLAKELQDKVTIAFRPHPLLKGKLCAHQYWGRKRTEDYYQKWHTAPGTLFSDEENYINLFKHSDAMILDSVSFLSEYLITGNPMLFVSNGETPGWNEFGEELWQIIEKTSSIEGIKQFIENILSQKDIYKNARQSFFENMLEAPLHEKSASCNIFTDICKDLELKNMGSL